MAQKFDSFVIFAEMRTGSNFLESNLNSFQGIACHGEAFNPHFIGSPNTDDILGVDQDARDSDPQTLLQAIREQPDKISGFRYFHDHDPRIVDLVMQDRRCAKIILTRNPVESYISWKIAQETGQWKLTDMKAHKSAKATFDAKEFDAHLEALQSFQLELMHQLQTSGQTAFYVAYEDLQSVDVMNGLARYLGVDETIEALDKNLKKQNPSPLSDKVENFDVMQATVSKLDRFDLTRTPNFEPRRGPAIPTYFAAAHAPLLYMPMRSGPEPQVLDWLAALDGVGRGKLMRKMSQKDLRQWKRSHENHRSFTVLRHPLDRAHDAFCTKILTTEKGGYASLRQTLRRRYKLPIPEGEPGAEYDVEAHKAAFIAFLTFLKGNLSGQTAIRVDPHWCSQAQALQGFGEFCFPDRVIREADMASELSQLAESVGIKSTAAPKARPAHKPFELAEIYTAEIEEITMDVYQRDYMMFGFSRWK